MDIWDSDKLALFITFVVPGFISLKAYGLLSPAESKGTSDQLIDAITYSSVNYALLMWPIRSIEQGGVKTEYPTAYALFYLFALLIAPICWACVFWKLRTTKFFRKSMPHPTQKPWDYVFGQLKPYWIIVTLRDGRKVGGRYDVNSFASSAPATEQLYLEEAWELNSDGGFERCRDDSAGMMILSSDMVTLEFFSLTYGGEDVEQQDDQRGVSSSEVGEGLSANAA